MTNSELDKLVAAGLITSYEVSTEEEVSGSSSRESERLTLHFSNGMKLQVDSVCSGFLENTGLFFEVQ